MSALLPLGCAPLTPYFTLTMTQTLTRSNCAKLGVPNYFTRIDEAMDFTTMMVRTARATASLGCGALTWCLCRDSMP